MSVRGLGSWRERERGGLNKACGVLAEWEGDDAEGMTLAVGIWEGRGGCDFCGLGANVVGVGGGVRWELVGEGGLGVQLGRFVW